MQNLSGDPNHSPVSIVVGRERVYLLQVRITRRRSDNDSTLGHCVAYFAIIIKNVQQKRFVIVWYKYGRQ